MTNAVESAQFSFHLGALGLPRGIKISVPSEITLSTPTFSCRATVVSLVGETITLEVEDPRIKELIGVSGRPSQHSCSWD
jgi:hypothetical protein